MEQSIFLLIDKLAHNNKRNSFMKRVLLVICLVLYGTLSFGQGCAEFDINPEDHSYKGITSAYRELLMKDVGEDATSLPFFFKDMAACWLKKVENKSELKKFSIREEDKDNHPELVFLIMNSSSLSGDEDKQNWFNLMPMMNSEQLAKLYDILERESLRVNAIELKYEEKRKLLSSKDNSSVGEEEEEDENSKRQLEFVLFGYRMVFEKVDILEVSTYDFSFVQMDGDNYVVAATGERYNKKEFVLIYPSDFYKSKKEILKEQPRAKEWFDDYLSKCYNYLKQMSDDSSFVLQDEMSQEWLLGYWGVLLEEYRKSLDKRPQLEEMALIPMENKIGNKHSKNQIKMHRYQYLQLVNTDRGDYGEAARCCAARVENEGLVSPQDFVFNLYLPILSYEDDEWKREGERLEDKFVQWYVRFDHDDFYEQIPADYTQTSMMVADYYLAFGQNAELREIVSIIKDRFVDSYKIGDLIYGKGIEGKWYEFLNHAYLDGSFSDGGLRYEDLERQVRQAGFEVKDTYMVEYACYYCLYQIINNSKSKGNAPSILRKVITKCSDKKSGTYDYIEKEIAKDLLARVNKMEDYRKPCVILHSPETKQLQTEDGDLRLAMYVGNGSMPMFEAKVFVGDELYGNKEFDRIDEKIWSFDKSVKLSEGDNTIIVTYKDASRNEYGDTIRVNYKPNDYTVRKDIALLFAVDKYDENKGYKSFNTDGRRPVQDAERFSKMLDEFGFETQVFENPTAEQMDNVLEHYAKIPYGKYDQLLLFFSGHGIMDEVTGEGYFVPTDGDSKRKARTMISYNRIKKLFEIRDGENTCRHILVIADACHSGSFIKESKGSAEENAKRIQSEAMEYVARCFIGSASPKEESNAESELMKAFAKLFDNKKKDYFDFSDLERAVRDEEGNKKEKGRWGDDQSQSSFYFNRKKVPK